MLDLALLARAGEEHAQLGLRQRVALGARRLEAEHVEHAVGGLRSTQTSGANTVKKARTGADTQSAVALGVAEGDALRHELADDDVEEGEDQVGEQDGEERRHPVVEASRERLLAERTDGRAR